MIAVTVEDGTGNPDANAYGDKAGYVAYWAQLGVDESAIDADLAAAAIIKATQCIDLVYGPRMKGQRNSRTQGLMYPRTGVVDDEGLCIESTEMPVELAKACYELTFRAKTDDILADIQPGAGLVSRKTVGPITVEYGGRGPVAYSPTAIYQKVDSIMETLCEGSRFQSSGVRG